jgi:hypothetical protein
MVGFVAPEDSLCSTEEEEVHLDWILGSLAGWEVGTLPAQGSFLLPVLLDGSRYDSQLGLGLAMASHYLACWVPSVRREALVDSDWAKSRRAIGRSVVVLPVMAASLAS